MIKQFVQANKKLSARFGAWVNRKWGYIDHCEAYFNSQLESIDLASARVLEIGGTGRPLFGKDEVLFYVGLDIDNEFDWADYYHQYINRSCTEPIDEKFDFIFSKYLLEHVNDNDKTFTNIIESLNSNGKSVHIFPLGYHPYSLLTRIVGNNLQRKLISVLRPEAKAVTGYPVFFDKCNSAALSSYFRKKPVKVEVSYFYGAEDYFGFFFPFFFMIVLYNRLAHFLRFSIGASNAVLVISKVN